MNEERPRPEVRPKGNPLLRRLAETAAEDGPRASAPRPSVIGRAQFLLALTLAAGAVTWGYWWRTAEPSLLAQVDAINRVGAAAGAVMVLILLVSRYRPIGSLALAAVAMLAQGVLLGCVAAALDFIQYGMFVNAFLGSVLVALAALALRRTRVGSGPGALPAAMALGLLALAAVNATPLGATLRLFAGSWLVWVVLVLVALMTAYSFGIDLDLVDGLAGDPRANAAALALAHGLTGMYAWRFFSLRTTIRP